MITTRIQRKRTAGWRAPKGSVYVGRPTKWGNPHSGKGQEVVDAYIQDLLDERLPVTIRDVISELQGKTISCWCPVGSPCHADALAAIANLDFTGLDLRGADLSHLDLSGADLSHSDLIEVDLSYSDLSHAELSFATICRSDLSSCNLSCADLTRANVTDVDLTDARLMDAKLVRASLLRANLSYADMRAADLSHAAIHCCDLAHIDMREVTLSHATLFSLMILGSDLMGANLAGARLERVTIQGTRGIRHASVNWGAPGEVGQHVLAIADQDGPGIDIYHCGCFRGTLQEWCDYVPRWSHQRLTDSRMAVTRMVGAILADEEG